MDRRTFLYGSIAAALATPLAAGAQPTDKVWRIGILSPGGPDPWEQRWEPEFVRASAAFGWNPAGSFVLERRYAGGNVGRLADLASELVRLPADLILAVAPPAAIAAKKATSTTPIVFIGVVDPVGLGLVRSLARPGGNVTGAAFGAGPELAGKQLELLREVVPNISRVAFLYNATNQAAALFLRVVQSAGQALNVTVRGFGLGTPDMLDGLAAEILEWRAEGVVLIGDPLMLALRDRIIDFVTQNRLPSVYALRQFVEDGGLLSYGWSESEVLLNIATIVDRILRGAKPADIPVRQPTRYELVVNARSARALGVTIPPSLLLRADQVIQ